MPCLDAGREDPDPAEHQSEGDDLESGEIDDAEDEDGRADDKNDGDQSGCARQPRGEPAQHPRRKNQQRRERQRHAGRCAVVQELLLVHGDESDHRHVEADARDEDRVDARGAHAPQAIEASGVDQDAADPERERDDQCPGRDERAVEHVPREDVERSELAEVQLPPVRVGGGQDGRQRPENGQGHEHADRVNGLVAGCGERGDQRDDADARPSRDGCLQRGDVSAPGEVVQQDERQRDEQSRDEPLRQARRERVDPVAPVVVMLAVGHRHLGASGVRAICENPGRHGGCERGQRAHRPVAPQGHRGVARGRTESENRHADREHGRA